MQCTLGFQVFYHQQGLPQLAEMNTPCLMDVVEEDLLYDKFTNRVYLVDGKPEEHSALRLLFGIKIEVVGKVAALA
jgi:hypothetical protein